MDSITISKVLTHLAYPAGLIGLLILFSVLALFRQKPRQAITGLLLSSVVFLSASNPLVSTYLVSRLEQQYPQQTMQTIQHADAIVVLGGSLRPPASPRQTSQLTNGSDRFWYAAQLFKAGKANKIVLTGGNVFADPSIQPEAFYIKQILIKLGIPETAILLEGNSKTTEENAQFSKQLIKQHRFKHILLVTSAMHMPRAVTLFKSPQLSITPCSADVHIASHRHPSVFDWMPNAKAFVASTLALHEYYGIAYYRLKTWLASFIQ